MFLIAERTKVAHAYALRAMVITLAIAAAMIVATLQDRGLPYR